MNLDKTKDRIAVFSVFDTKFQTAASVRGVLDSMKEDKWGKKIQQSGEHLFAVTSKGELILIDEKGKYEKVPERFKFQITFKPKQE